MSTDIYLSEATDDIDFVNNTMRLTNTIEELTRQKVQIHLATFKGEWFANILAGIPYLANNNNPEQLLGKADKRFFDVAIKTGILSRDGIVDLTSYESVLNKNTRGITVSFKATTESGDIVSIDNVEIGI